MLITRFAPFSADLLTTKQFMPWLRTVVFTSVKCPKTLDHKVPAYLAKSLIFWHGANTSKCGKYMTSKLHHNSYKTLKTCCALYLQNNRKNKTFLSAPFQFQPHRIMFSTIIDLIKSANWSMTHIFLFSNTCLEAEGRHFRHLLW
jgi:hypothetical protein